MNPDPHRLTKVRQDEKVKDPTDPDSGIIKENSKNILLPLLTAMKNWMHTVEIRERSRMVSFVPEIWISFRCTLQPILKALA
jgi:hypothetical protein